MSRLASHHKVLSLACDSAPIGRHCGFNPPVMIESTTVLEPGERVRGGNRIGGSFLLAP
jgi:hypothetical protein